MEENDLFVQLITSGKLLKFQGMNPFIWIKNLSCFYFAPNPNKTIQN